MLLNELSKKEKESYICFNNVPKYIQYTCNNKIIIGCNIRICACSKRTVNMESEHVFLYV